MDELLNIFGTKVSKCVSSIPTLGQWWKFKKVFSKPNKEAIKLGQGHFVKGFLFACPRVLSCTQFFPAP